MAALVASYGLYFAQPWWLLACALAAGVIYLGMRNLGSLGKARRITAITLRVLVVLTLATMLAKPMLSRTNEELTVLAVVDRSLSIPRRMQDAGVDFINASAKANKKPTDQLAVVDIAEVPNIAQLASGAVALEHRDTMLKGDESYIEGGVEMALAIAPPDTAKRILLVSDGNETRGDLREVARTAAANRIPIDVLPLRYRHENEVVFTRLVAPSRAKKGQTVGLRMVLTSTGYAQGTIFLTMGNSPDKIPLPVTLKAGTNVKTIDLPVPSVGMHKFEATYVPDKSPSGESSYDQISQNNIATAMTFVAGPRQVMVVDGDPKRVTRPSQELQNALLGHKIDARYVPAWEFPTELGELMGIDCIVMCDTENAFFSQQQQDMLVRYVNDMGGGLVMTGGPNSFGAGGWIGSPVANILPVDLDPKQKQEMPKGALVLVMHACEMQAGGNYWATKTAEAAVKVLSRLDLVGVISFQMQDENGKWDYPLSPAGNKAAVLGVVNNMQLGDFFDFTPHISSAYKALKACDAGQKHIIIISDGDPAPPSKALLDKCRASKITITGVSIDPHGATADPRFRDFCIYTGGRFYDVQNANQLPQIFIKEAQVVRRSLIVEEPFTPRVSYSLNRITDGFRGFQKLDGYVLTEERKGLAQTILKSDKGDPVLAAWQSGLGRVVAFTSAADSRWCASWLGWEGYNTFWKQAVEWTSRSSNPADCEIFTEVQGRRVDVSVEAVDAKGNFLQYSSIAGQVIAPDMSTREITLRQVGPGKYHAQFIAQGSGSYLLNLQYSKPGSESRSLAQSVVNVPFAPEFQDLSDNAALLSEIAQITGGRVLGGDGANVNLFDTTGVSFPQVARPLTNWLAIAFIALFIADVAVRRLALDFKSIMRRHPFEVQLTAAGLWFLAVAAAALVAVLRYDWPTFWTLCAAVPIGLAPAVFFVLRARGKVTKTADETVDRLRSKRQQVRKTLDQRSRELSASRYETQATDAGELHKASATTPASDQRTAAPTAKPAPKPQEDETSIGRLLKAKKRTEDRLRGDK